MNKRELVDKIAADAHLSKVQAARALDAFIDVVHDSLVRGDRVTLVGFGTFAVSSRKGRMVREPRGGVPMRIAPRRVARFAAGMELREALDRNGGPEATPSP